MMGRQPEVVEGERERVEGQLACLGNAVVLLLLVSQRMQIVIAMVGRRELVQPAIEDLERVERLIVRAQRSIAQTVPGSSSRGGGGKIMT